MTSALGIKELSPLDEKVRLLASFNPQHTSLRNHMPIREINSSSQRLSICSSPSTRSPLHYMIYNFLRIHSRSV